MMPAKDEESLRELVKDPFAHDLRDYLNNKHDGFFVKNYDDEQGYKIKTLKEKNPKWPFCTFNAIE